MRLSATAALACLALSALATRAEALTAHHQKTLAPKPGATLSVEGSFHDITVTLSPGATAVEVAVDLRVTRWPGDAKEALAALAPTFEESASGIRIRSTAKGFMAFGFLSGEGAISVTMPPGMGLRLSCGSGEITVTGDTGGMPVACEAGSGDIRFEGSAPSFEAETGSGDTLAVLSGAVGKVRLEAGSGEIEFTGAARDFRAETGSGSITAKGLVGAASFEAGSGDVEAAFAALPVGAEVSADTGSGSVRLMLPAGLEPSGVLDSGSGEVRCDFKGASDEEHDTFTLSGRGPALHVETGSGDIAVLAAR